MPKYIDLPEGQLEVPDHFTEEQAQASVREVQGSRARDAIEAGQKRQAEQQGLTDMLTGLAMAPIRGIAKVPGKAVQMGKSVASAAKGLVTGTWLEEPAPREMEPGESEFLESLSAGEFAGEFPVSPYDPTTKAVARVIPPTLLGGVGALAGPVGAGLGVMAGESLVQAAERSAAASAGEPVQPPIEMIEDLIATGVLGGASEAIPQMAVRAAGAPARAFQRGIHPRGREAMETLPFEARPSLAQISKSRAADIAENITESSLLGGGRITAQKARAEKVARELLEQEVGLLPAKGDPRLNRLSDKIDELGADVLVDTTETRRVAEQLLRKERPLGEFADDRFTAVMKKIIGLGTPEEIVPGIPAMPGPAGFTARVGGTPAIPPVTALRQVSFADARGMRSQLLEMSRSPVGTLASKSERGAVRHLEKLLKKDMLESAAAGGHQALVATYQNFNTIARKASTRGHFEDAINKATTITADGPLLDGNKLVNNLFHAKKELRGSLDPEALSRVEKFSRVLQVAQSKSVEGTGRVMVQLTQAGAAGALATGSMTGKAAAVLGLPYVMARALTSKVLYRYLVDGFKYAGTPRGNAAINSLLAGAAEEEAAEERQGQPEETPWTPPWEVSGGG